MLQPVTVRNINQDTITQAVIARHTEAPDGRLRELMTCLVQHLHAFARESRLSEAEWLAGIHFLTETGQLCSERRQEFLLLSDVLGLSMLVTAMNQRKLAGCTESTVSGPLRAEAPRHDSDAPQGGPCFVRGHVRSIDGSPVAGAELQVGPSDADGSLARVRTGPGGEFQCQTAAAAPHTIAHDGTVGRLLAALGRHAWRPAHLHFMVVAPGFERLVTHVFRQNGRYLDSDAVFGVRPSLVADWVRHEPGRTPDGGSSALPFCTLDFDFVLQPTATP